MFKLVTVPKFLFSTLDGFIKAGPGIWGRMVKVNIFFTVKAYIYLELIFSTVKLNPFIEMRVVNALNNGVKVK